MTHPNGNGPPDKPDLSSPWQRLLIYFRDHGGGPAYFDMACGFHLGLAVALDHPTWAHAMNESFSADMKPGAKPTSEIVDRVVEDVPVEVVGS